MVAACILAPEGPRLTPQDKARFRALDPWGFILFARNVEDPAQLSALTSDLRDSVGRDCPVLVDQEGGRVQRLRAPHWREWVPPLDQVESAGEDAARMMFLRGALIGAELRGVGIDTDCAPCADVASAATHPFLRNRCYGEAPDVVVHMARAMAAGLLAGGCLPVMKHLPGHGAATVDSHLHLPVVGEDRATLRARDFAPFAALADLPMAMTAHVVYPAFDDAAPATQSREMLHLIRGEIGFQGLVMTDDISMEALSGDLDQRTRAAIAAGCDLVLYCKGEPSECELVTAAAGPLTGQALSRAEAALAARPAGPTLDIEAAEDEFLALQQGGG
ncbi:beta-N-acetylhexosaminidase [Frigidibacter sp. ROC022]|uniref:beta-N-acetylhexosaminidase n=1 Tax=Frigidibacter sp. ROC022 TaxID=2971796 RepID=UPI00215B75B6|nr:beta-N-acetylhexosaminidase [Frigidibacter sp. ROC022]MCR8725250.1 beta-N-acetylhexosaminidase [Frigidibacter sp. ROC022]